MYSSFYCYSSAEDKHISVKMRTQRYADEVKQENIRKHKVRKRILIVLIVLLLIGVSAEIAVILIITDIDWRFTRSMSRGLEAGWELSANDLQMQKTGRITDTGFIDAEYEAISEYVDKKYKDNELGKLANEYISALKACRTAAETHDPEKDFDKFWADFSEPYAHRLHAIYGMYNGDFGMTIDDDHIEASSYTLAQGWLQDTIHDLSFNKKADGDTLIFSARVKNESGYDIDYLDLRIELYDDSDDHVETSSAYVTDVPAGKSFDLRFLSVSGKATKYRISGEILELGKRDVNKTED